MFRGLGGNRGPHVSSQLNFCCPRRPLVSVVVFAPKFFQESLSPPMPMNSLSLPCVFERACDRLPCFVLAASRSWFGAFEGEPVASYFPNRLSYLSSGMLTQSSCMAYSVPGGLLRK